MSGAGGFLEMFGTKRGKKGGSVGEKMRPKLPPGSGGFSDNASVYRTPLSSSNGGPPSGNFPSDDSEARIDALSDEEIVKEFEKMLVDMNLSEEKRQPLSKVNMETKRTMLKQYSTTTNVKRKVETARDYAAQLSNLDGMSAEKLFRIVESLRIALSNNPVSWLKDFIEADGLEKLLTVFKKYKNKFDQKHEKIEHEAIRCVSAIMNNTPGLKYVYEHQSVIEAICSCITVQKTVLMPDAVRLLAALCLVPPSGHEKVLMAITHIAEEEGTDRFGVFVQGMSYELSDTLRAACFALVNALLANTEDFDFRCSLRFELMRIGLKDVLLRLETEELSDELRVQLDAFRSNKENDQDELAQRYDNVCQDFTDPREVFELILSSVGGSQAELSLLAILQDLLLIRDDVVIRPAYYYLLESVVHQVVLHKNGGDPDFNIKAKFSVDCEEIIQNISNNLRDEGMPTQQIQKRLEEALTQKQEMEAKLANYEAKLQQLNAGGQVSPTKIMGPPNLMGGGPPPPPPMPGMGGPPPPPPMPGMGGPRPPPPPPPPPGMGGPPPPPPMPGMGGPPPPPPMPGMGGPPPPPLPGGMSFAPLAPPQEICPPGMKPKKKYEVGTTLKRANWKKVMPQKISQKSFWVKVNEEQLASDDLFNELNVKFSSAPPAKVIKNGDDTATLGGRKAAKELKVLDAKAAQNLMILQGSLKMSAEEIKNCILTVNEEALTDAMLQQLLRYMPAADQLSKLSNLKDDYENLAEAEKFAFTVGSIKRLHARLKSISFKLRFQEMVQDIKPDIVSATEACEEIKASKKFARILEFVLLLGNYMNSGTRNAQAFGFEISYLPKLVNTKSSDQKMTLLHFLVNTIEQKMPEVLTFGDELQYADRAARVSTDQLQKNLTQMKRALAELDTDLKNFKPQTEHDRFAEVLTPFFREAQEVHDVLQGMFKKMERLYDELADYYAFEAKKYTLDEFFGDIKTFKEQFEQCYGDNLRAREMEEKRRRDREAKEKAEKDRKERLVKKRQLVDMAKDQEGLMDSLLEALSTGTAFQQKPRRKVQQSKNNSNKALLRTRSRSGIALAADHILDHRTIHPYN